MAQAVAVAAVAATAEATAEVAAAGAATAVEAGVVVAAVVAATEVIEATADNPDPQSSRAAWELALARRASHRGALAMAE